MSGEKKEVMIDFGKSFASSELFDKIFKEGMSLVEETASYLDGDGRVQSKSLSRSASYVYASESMRLTTHLSASIDTGTPPFCQNLKIREFSTVSSENLAEMPEQLQALIHNSLRLNERILRLDEMLRGEHVSETTESNPVNDQVSRLQQAFG